MAVLGHFPRLFSFSSILPLGAEEALGIIELLQMTIFNFFNFFFFFLCVVALGVLGFTVSSKLLLGLSEFLAFRIDSKTFCRVR